MNCQIEYGSSDSDIGTPCGKTAVAKSALTADLRSALTAVRSAAKIRSVISATTTTSTHSCMRKPVENERHYPTLGSTDKTG